MVVVVTTQRNLGQSSDVLYTSRRSVPSFHRAFFQLETSIFLERFPLERFPLERRRPPRPPSELCERRSADCALVSCGALRLGGVHGGVALWSPLRLSARTTVDSIIASTRSATRVYCANACDIKKLFIVG